MRTPEIDDDDDDDDDDALEHEIEHDDATTFEDEVSEVPEVVDAADPSESAESAELVEPATLEHPEGGRIQTYLPLGDLVVEYRHWVNPRTFTGLDDESLQALRWDIAGKTITAAPQDGEPEHLIAGIDEPLRIVRIAAAQGVVNLVIDGQRRHRAAQMTGFGHTLMIPVFYREVEPVEWTEPLARRFLKEVLTVVGLRQGLSGYELSEAAMRLDGTPDEQTGKPITVAAIATCIGRSASWTSRILTARKAASPKVLRQWQRSEISEEQFKELTTGIKDLQEQEREANQVADQRKKGDKAAARTSAKERAEIARQQAKDARAAKVAAKQQAKDAAKAAKVAAKEAKRVKKPAVKGPQAELPMAPAAKAVEPKAPTAPSKPKPMSFAVVEDLMTTARRKPATHDLVKGILLGIQVASGMIDLQDLPKPWHAYIHHLSGTKPSKPKRVR